MSLENASGGQRRRSKRRRHGYRGYGSPLRKDQGGAIHWGRGFAGVGFPGQDGGVLPPESKLLPRDLRGQDGG